MSNPVLVGMTYSIRKVFNGGKFSRRGIAYLSIPAVTSTKVTFPSRTYQEGQEQITMSSPDQAPFSEDVRKNCAGTCVLTGVRARQRTEAAHIKPRHAGGEPDVTNGILLRSDIHTLFDNWHFSIDPDSMKARFSPDVLSVDKDLLQLEGKQIDFSRLQMPINIEYLRHHWNEFFNRHGNPFRKKEPNNKNQQL
ncbi:HNH endonuclease [Klebsiella grimontii]|nr:HNH endonuclease signature motif containing protein [Klebsiella grimontii]